MAQVAARLQVLADPAILLEIEDAGQGVEADDVAAGQDVNRIDSGRVPFAFGEPAREPLAILAPVDVGIREQAIRVALGLHGGVCERERIPEVRGVFGHGAQDDQCAEGLPARARRQRRQAGGRDQVREGDEHQHVAVADLGMEGEREVAQHDDDVDGQKPDQRMAADRALEGRPREPVDLGAGDQERCLQQPHQQEVVGDAARMATSEHDHVPVAALGGEGGVEGGHESRRQRQAQAGEGRGQAQEESRSQIQRAQGASDLAQQVGAADDGPGRDAGKQEQRGEASTRRRAARARRQEGDEANAGQEEHGGDLGHERGSQGDPEDRGTRGRGRLRQPVGGEEGRQGGAGERHVRGGQARVRHQVGIERGPTYGQRPRERSQRPPRGVDEAKEQREPDDGGSAGEEAQGIGIRHTGGARRLHRQHAGQHDRGLGVEPLLAHPLADSGVEETLGPLEMERLVVGPPFLAGGPQGVAERARGEGQGQHLQPPPCRWLHLRPPPCRWLDVHGPRPRGAQRTPIRRLTGGTPRILHSPRTTPRRFAP